MCAAIISIRYDIIYNMWVFFKKKKIELIQYKVKGVTFYKFTCLFEISSLFKITT